MGSKHHNIVVLKRLREAIEKEKDPDTLAKLTAQFVKLNAQKRPRKSEAPPSSKKNRSLREIYAGCAMADLSDGELVLDHIVLEIEKRQRAGQLKTKDERGVFIAEVLGSLSEDERAAYEALERGEGC